MFKLFFITIAVFGFNFKDLKAEISTPATAAPVISNITNSTIINSTNENTTQIQKTEIPNNTLILPIEIEAPDTKITTDIFSNSENENLKNNLQLLKDQIDGFAAINTANALNINHTKNLTIEIIEPTAMNSTPNTDQSLINDKQNFSFGQGWTCSNGTMTFDQKIILKLPEEIIIQEEQNQNHNDDRYDDILNQDNRHFAPPPPSILPIDEKLPDIDLN